MKNLIVNYDIFASLDRKILVLADFHDLSEDKTQSLIPTIMEENADLIVLAGDIIQGPKYRNKKSLQKLKYFLSQISENNTPVVLEKGNHDLVGYNEESRKGYLSLEDARPGMVFPLDNSSVTIDGMRVMGFCPTRPAFSPSLQESGAALRYFARDWLKSGLAESIDPNLYNILVSHNPKTFAQAISVGQHRKLQLSPDLFEDLEIISDQLTKINLGLAGHLHNGYLTLEEFLRDPDKYMDLGIWEMPMEKDSHERITMIRPWVMKKTDLCRGTVYVGKEESRYIQLPNGNIYYQQRPYATPTKVIEGTADSVELAGRVPMVISGGVNKFFNLPVDAAEITRVNVKKLVR
jgi:predicted MPP superfamily phosphohydrolase